MAGFAFLFLTGMYFLPTIVAAARGNRNTIGVGLLNFFTGWTFIGWIGALIWALCEHDCQHVVYVNVPYGAQQPQQQPQQWYVPPQQAQYADRSGPPMNVRPPRRGWNG